MLRYNCYRVKDCARHKTSTEAPASKTPSCEVENTHSTLDMLPCGLVIGSKQPGHTLTKKCIEQKPSSSSFVPSRGCPLLTWSLTCADDGAEGDYVGLYFLSLAEFRVGSPLEIILKLPQLHQ